MEWLNEALNETTVATSQGTGCGRSEISKEMACVSKTSKISWRGNNHIFGGDGEDVECTCIFKNVRFLQCDVVLEVRFRAVLREL